jgi:hypothetical protein
MSIEHLHLDKYTKFSMFKTLVLIFFPTHTHTHTHTPLPFPLMASLDFQWLRTKSLSHLDSLSTALPPWTHSISQTYIWSIWKVSHLYLQNAFSVWLLLTDFPGGSHTVSFHLLYCFYILARLPASTFGPLASVLNKVARTNFKKYISDHVIPIFKIFCCFSISSRGRPKASDYSFYPK